MRAVGPLRRYQAFASSENNEVLLSPVGELSGYSMQSDLTDPESSLRIRRMLIDDVQNVRIWSSLGSHVIDNIPVLHTSQ
jgi:hypothetical protein